MSLGVLLRKRLRRMKNKLKRRRAFAATLGLVMIWVIGMWGIQWGPMYPLESPRLVSGSIDPKAVQGMNQFVPQLWNHVKKNHIIQPSKLNYSFPFQMPRNRVLSFIEKPVDHVLLFLFRNKTGGVFVEVGAYDGWWSHTLGWEVYMGWTGLLIECHPEFLSAMKSLNRKAYIADVCVSKSTHSGKGLLTSADNQPGASSLLNKDYLFPEIITNYTAYEVQTIPLFAIMKAVNILDVDMIVLMVQGLEEDVLRNFPFHQVNVKVWVIEVEFMDIYGQLSLKKLMEQQGYPGDKFWARGSKYIFAHESFEIEYPKMNGTLNQKARNKNYRRIQS